MHIWPSYAAYAVSFLTIGIIAVVSVLMLVRNGSETPVEEMDSFSDLMQKLTEERAAAKSAPKP